MLTVQIAGFQQGRTDTRRQDRPVGLAGGVTTGGKNVGTGSKDYEYRR